MSNVKPLPVESARVEIRRSAIRVPFAISRETRTAADCGYVFLSDAAGCCGIGEFAPFPTLTHDTISQAESVVHAILPDLAGRTADAALRLMDLRRPEIFRASVTALAAIEMALYDLKARQEGRSLASLFGQAGLSGVESDITVPIMSPDQVAAFLEGFSGYGFSTFKIKVAGRVHDDLDLVRSIMRQVPPGSRFTLDGNQGYDVDGATALVNALGSEGLVPELFEQPLPEDDWDGHGMLSSRIAVPVCVDETVRTLADAERLVNDGIARAANIKVMKSGVSEAHRMVTLLKAGGIRLMIGGMLESEFAMGVSLHLACGTGAFCDFDLDTPFFFSRSVAGSGPWQQCRAWLACPDGPGTGLVWQG